MPDRSTLTSDGTWDQAEGRGPSKLYEARFTPVGRPPVHVTPVHTGEHGSELEVHPLRLAALHKLGVTPAETQCMQAFEDKMHASVWKQGHASIPK